MIRNITGVGEGHGPYIAIHDGFQGTGAWADFLQGSDRVLLGASFAIEWASFADFSHYLYLILAAT